jgi:hypothetical protein
MLVWQQCILSVHAIEASLNFFENLSDYSLTKIIAIKETNCSQTNQLGGSNYTNYVE